MKSHHTYRNDEDPSAKKLPGTVLEAKASKEESDMQNSNTFSNTMPANASDPKKSLART